MLAPYLRGSVRPYGAVTQFAPLQTKFKPSGSYVKANSLGKRCFSMADLKPNYLDKLKLTHYLTWLKEVAKNDSTISKYKIDDLERNDGHDLFRLYVDLSKGDRVPKNIPASFDFLKLSANKEYPSAMNDLAGFLLRSPDTADQKFGEKLLKKAYKKGSSEAAYNLGMLYLDKGTLRSGMYKVDHLHKARKFFEFAVLEGCFKAKGQLSDLKIKCEFLFEKPSKKTAPNTLKE